MNNFFHKTRRHFLPCEDTAGGSQLSGGGNIFFQLNKEELSLRATMDLVGPSRQALHVQSSFDDSRLLTMPHERSEAVDDGEAPDGNDSEMGRRGSGVAD